MLVSKDNFLFTCPKQWALRRNTGAKCATKRIKHAKRDAPSWLAAGLKLRKPSLCIYHNSFRGLSICRIQRRCLEGEARSTISNAGREKREQGKARWKGVRYSRIAQCLDSFFFFFLNVVPITHFSMFWGRTCMLNAAISSHFTAVTLRPLKKAEADLPLMKAIWPRNSRLHNFCWDWGCTETFFRSSNIVFLFISGVALCLPPAPAYSRVSCLGLSVWISGQLLHVFIFSPLATHAERKKKDLLKASFPPPPGKDD